MPATGKSVVGSRLVCQWIRVHILEFRVRDTEIPVYGEVIWRSSLVPITIVIVRGF